MSFLFEWDAAKATANLNKHGVSFEEATEVFADPLMRLIHDAEHSGFEERYIALGMSSRQRLVVTVHMDRRDRIRIISARLATATERLQYEEGE